MPSKARDDQIIDAVTQANAAVLSDAPEFALATVLQTTAHSLSMAAQNAASAQHQMTITSQAATTMGIATLFALDSALLSKSAAAILSSSTGS